MWSKKSKLEIEDFITKCSPGEAAEEEIQKYLE